MSAAEELRRAAEVLRERAGAATPGPWVMHGVHPTYNIGHGEHVEADLARGLTREDSSYIATVHPGVGLLLADWLELAAAIYDHGDLPLLAGAALVDRALAVARAINRDTT